MARRGISLIFVIAIVFLIFYFFRRNHDDHWRVAMKSFPPRISTTMAHSLTASYIIKQTHATVFFKDRFGSYRSDILNRWSKDLNDNSLHFCIDQPRAFSPGIYFDVEALKTLIKNISQKEELAISINSTNENCISVETKGMATKLISLMSELEYAPTAKSGDERYELGLGEFKITKVSSDEVLLSRKSKVNGQFNYIDFIKIDGPKDKKLTTIKFNDYNLVGEELIPLEAKQYFRSVKATTLKSNVLLLNISDKTIRKAIFSCVDSIDLSKALYGKAFKGLNSSSLIPRGMAGFEITSKKIQCAPYEKRNLKTPVLKFVTWHSENELKIKNEVEKLGKRAGVNIVTEFYSYPELTEILYRHKENFNLLPITIDTKNGSLVQLFESFGLPEKSLLSFTVPNVRNGFQKLRQVGPNSEKLKISAQELNSEILEQALAVPLFQPEKTYYYPQNIDEIFLGDDFLDFPHVARFKL